MEIETYVNCGGVKEMKLEMINYVSRNGKWTELEKLSPEERREWSRTLLDALIKAAGAEWEEGKKTGQAAENGQEKSNVESCGRKTVKSKVQDLEKSP